MRILWATRHDEYCPDRCAIHRLYWRAQERHGHTCARLGRRDALFPWRLYGRIRQFRPDVLFVGNFVTFWAVWLRRLGLTGAPIVNCWNEILREASPWADLPGWVQRLVRPLLRRVEIWQARHSDASIVSGRQNAVLGREFGARNVYYLVNARAPDPKPRSSVRLEGEGFKIAYLGDQSGWNRKNLGMLFDAVRGEACTLYMIGRVHEPTRRRAPENVVFTGEVPAEEAHAVLLQADLLINCTDQDADAKNGEYIFAGKPLLVYRGRGMQENLFTHLHDAYIADDLKAGLRRLMADASLRERLGRNLRALPVQDFNERADRMMEIIEQQVQARRAAGRRSPADGESP